MRISFSVYMRFKDSDLEGRPKSTFSADSETPSQVYVSGNHGCMWHRLVAVRATTDRQTKPSLAFPLPGMSEGAISSTETAQIITD